MRHAVHYDELPLAVRQRIKGARRERAERVQSEMPGQRLWQCCACGEVLTSWAASERHCDEQRHFRIECVISQRSDATAESE